MNSIITNMQGKTTVTQDFVDTTALLRQFYNANNSTIKDPNKVLKYYEVRQPFDNSGNTKDTEIKQFIIIW